MIAERRDLKLKMDLSHRFPKNAKAFYIEHYKRYRLQNNEKGVPLSKGNLYIEAIRSWRALDPDDKKLIIDKYNKVAAQFHNKVADYITTAVDYNPVRKTITTRNDKEVPNDAICDDEVTMESVTHKNDDTDDKEKSNANYSLDGTTDNPVSEELNTSDQAFDCQNISPPEPPKIEDDKELPNDVTCDEVTMKSETDQNKDTIDEKEKSNVNMDGTTDNPVSEELNTSDQAFECQNISPPEPPKIKTAEELFKLVNSELDETHWKILPRRKREYYRKAVLSLKKDYIQKYETYLRSLPSKDLYRLKCQH